MNQIATIPSSALATDVAPYLSQKYVRIDTKNVIQIMEDSGFVVSNIRQDQTRSRDPRWVRHCVDFRRPTDGMQQYVPRFLFTNSHNGTTRASFRLGVYRYVCSNGMVIGNDWARESFIHQGDLAKQVIERVKVMAAATAPLFEQIEKWQKKELTHNQRHELAQIAAEIRYGKNPAVTLDLLTVRRPEDHKHDLWTVFNRIQENAVRGGLAGLSATGRNITTKPIASIGNDFEFNVKFWQAAEQFA